MFNAKAITAVLAFGLGASAMGVAVYSQNPMAFTTAVAPHLPTVAAPETPVAVLPDRTPDNRPMTRAPVPVPHMPQAATPAQPEQTVILPCSGWQDMASGPEGRRVRYLCQMPPPNEGPPPGS